jgi:hypothetical protein
VYNFVADVGGPQKISVKIPSEKTTETRPTITVEVASDGGSQIALISLSIDNILVGTSTTGLLMYTPLDALGYGKHTVKVTISDKMGHLTSKAYTFEVVKDTTAEVLEITGVHNYPNPFDGTTQIVLEGLNKDVSVVVKIFDFAGDLTRTINRTPELYNNKFVIKWDGRNDNDKLVANGVYLAQVTATDGRTTKRFVIKMVVLR